MLMLRVVGAPTLDCGALDDDYVDDDHDAFLFFSFRP